MLPLLLLHLHEVCGAGPACSASRSNFMGPGGSAECSWTSLGASMKAAMVALAMGFESASLRAIHWNWTLCKLSLPLTTLSRLLSDIMGFKDPSPTMKAGTRTGGSLTWLSAARSRGSAWGCPCWLCRSP